jgi:putative ABC transport system permease protein
VPMSGHQRGGGFGIAGREGEGEKEAEHNTVVPGYFETIGTPLLRGRDFSAADVLGAPLVVLVNRALAEKEWPNQNAVGQHIVRDRNGPPFEVIGIVETSRFYAVDEPPLAMFFFPLAQRSESSMAVLVKTGLDRITLASTLTRELHALDPRLTLSPLRAINDYTHEQLSTVEASARLTSAIGMLAFVLSALGVFSVVSYNVAQRRREIAVRLALGASGASILLLLVRAGVVLTAAGLAAGALLARLGVARVSAALEQLRPLETHVLLAAVALLGFCALAACVVPATRSLRVDVRKMLGPE